jgi:hypothetical protein
VFVTWTWVSILISICPDPPSLPLLSFRFRTRCAPLPTILRTRYHQMAPKNLNTPDLHTATSPATTVPPELLLDIMEDAANPPVDFKRKYNYRTRTLCMLSRVNKHWHATSMAPLYRRLTFNNKPGQMAKLRRTVVHSPAFAAMVMELSIRVMGEQDLPTGRVAMRKALARRRKVGKENRAYTQLRLCIW